MSIEIETLSFRKVVSIPFTTTDFKCDNPRICTVVSWVKSARMIMVWLLPKDAFLTRYGPSMIAEVFPMDGTQYRYAESRSVVV